MGNSCFPSLKDRSKERQRNSFVKNTLKCSHIMFLFSSSRKLCSIVVPVL